MMMRAIAVVTIAGLIAYCGPVNGQDPDSLKILVIEGDGSLNNIKSKQGRRPVVEVRDEENQPVSGVRVVFSLPAYGAGGNFVDGSRTATVVTDNRGQATMPEFRPNTVEGRFDIRAAASYGERRGAARIVQTNSVAGGSNMTERGSSKNSSKKLLVLLGLAGAAGSIVAVIATRGGKGGATASATTITVGSVTVGGPR